MNVADYIAQTLKERVRHVFGYPGRANLKLIDSFISGGLEYVQTCHEQAAAMAADAYSRITGGLGACTSTSGPGATNLLTGLANAYFDSVPCIFLTGQDNFSHINKSNGARQNGFQEVNCVAMSSPITKYSTLIKSAYEVPYKLSKALYLAFEARPGPVLLDVPIDIQFQDLDVARLRCFKPNTSPVQTMPPQSIEAVVRFLTQARRPVVLAGGGLRLAIALDEFKTFVVRTGLPVVSTLNGLDSYTPSYGFAGLNGNTHANLLINNADFLLVLGSRLALQHAGKVRSDYTRAMVFQVDIDPAEQNREFASDLFINADLALFLKNLNRELESEKLPDWSGWIEVGRVWQEKYACNSCHNNAGGLDPVQLVSYVSEISRDRAVFTVDVGQNQMWAAQGLRLKVGQRFLSSSGHGAMGYSLPAAIGAAIGSPGSPVVAFTGDGGLQMNSQELAVMAKRALDIKLIVFNNKTLGMIREIQDKYYGARHHGTARDRYSCPDLKLLALSYGLDFFKICRREDIGNLRNVLNRPGPVLIEVEINFNSTVLNRYDEAHIFKQEKIKD